jgi:large subunit ribosomal protein L17
MRHRKAVKKLGRTKSHRRALLMNLANSLFLKERIITTVAKARSLRSVAERLITYGKENTLHARRLAFAFLRDKGTVKKIFTDVARRYEGVNGGYVRVLKIGRRRGDSAPLCLVELTRRVQEQKAKKE